MFIKPSPTVYPDEKENLIEKEREEKSATEDDQLPRTRPFSVQLQEVYRYTRRFPWTPPGLFFSLAARGGNSSFIRKDLFAQYASFTMNKEIRPCYLAQHSLI
ncbi:hypothetical protein WAI453_001358 [Rhynchosporium graminicola]